MSNLLCAPMRQISRVVAIAAVTAAMLAAMMAFASPAEAQPNPCTVSNADGGIDVSWAVDANAATYVYRLEVAGQNNRYKQVNDTQAFIELAEGVTGTVFVSAKYANGSYSSSAACGSGQANDGTGGDPDGGTQTCTVTSTAGGIGVTWTAVDNAAGYVYRLEVEGKPNRYRRESGLDTYIPLLAGQTGRVFVSAVFANGTYSPSADCGSGSAADGTGGNEPSCSLQNTVDGTLAQWSNVTGAVRYVYRIDEAGRPPRYRVTNEIQAFIDGAPGTTVSVAVSGQLANGTYTGAVGCGSITIGGGNGGIDAPANCDSTPVPANADESGATISWDAVAGASSYIVYHQEYRAPQRTEVSVTGTSYFLPIELWYETNVSVAAVDSNGSVSDESSCGRAEPGQPLGPATCSVADLGLSQIVDWDAVPRTSNYVVAWTSDGVTQQQGIGGGSTQLALPVASVTEVTVTANVVEGGPGPGATVLSETTTCDLGIGDIDAPANCTSTPVPANADESGATISWDSVAGASSYFVYYQPFRAPNRARVSVTGTSYFLPIELWFSTDVSVTAVDGNGDESVETSCGRAEPGPVLPPASCTVSNGTVTWDAVPRTANYVVSWSVNGVVSQQGVGGGTTQFALPAGADTVGVAANVVEGGPGPGGTVLSDSRTCV